MRANRLMTLLSKGTTVEDARRAGGTLRVLFRGWSRHHPDVTGSGRHVALL